MSQLHPRNIALADPERPAVIMADSGASLSFAALEARANQTAHAFRSAGLQAGDTVAYVLKNRLELFPFVWGAQRAGLIYVPISTRLTNDEMTYILEDSGAAMVLTEDDSSLPTGKSLSQWSAELDTHPATPIVDESLGRDMLYSSGTTGRPKGIAVKHEPGQPIDRMSSLSKIARHMFDVDAQSVYLSPAPLYHAAPLRWVMAVQYLGATVVVMDRFDAAGALTAIDEHAVTHAQFVPTHFSRMLELPELTRRAFGGASLRHAIHAAAPCPKPLKQQMIDWWGPVITEYYSGSEGIGMTMITTPDWLEHPGSVGRAVLGELHICGPGGQPQPPDTVGDVYFDSPRSFAYHKDDEKTRASHNANGWVTMGDVGYLDDEGYLYLTDRKSFMIISGGVNVYPQEIEDHLLCHDAVRDVAVIGTPCGDLGEQVTAVIELHDPALADDQMAETLRTYTSASMSGVKVPRRIEFTTALPRTETGKLLKKKLRDSYWPEAG